MSAGTLVIEPGRSAKNYWRDLWRYRELLYFLTWRDITVRYKQTAIGIAWAVIQPALTMLVFVAFRRMTHLGARGASDDVLVLAAVLPWQFFSTALSDSSGSLIGNSNLISKVYFPRIIIPCASIATSLADFTVALGLLAVLMAWAGVAPSWSIVMLPAFTALALLLAAGSGLLLAALNVRYRDFRYVIPFVVQFGLYLSPVAFKTSDIPARWRGLYILNPMAGVIDGFRWAILGGAAPPDTSAIEVSVVAAAGLLLIGVWYFRRVERTFADVI